MADVTVAILGLGRLGASIGLALKRYIGGESPAHNFTITGYDERGYNGRKAKEMGALDRVARSPHEAVDGAHIIFLALSYDVVEEMYEKVGLDLAPGAVVLDASPLKMPSLGWAKRYLQQDPERAAYMVGVTPVFNPELLLDSALDLNDPDHARPDLLDKSSMIIAPAADTPSEAVDLAAEFTRILGTGVHFMDPMEHDGLTAATEGLPALVGVALFRALHGAAWGDARRLTNPAFGLATRHLAVEHPDALWTLLHLNRQNTARHLTALIETLEALRTSLEEDADGLELESVLAEAASDYKTWEQQRFGNKWEKADTGPQAPGVLGAIGAQLLGGRLGRRGKDDDES